MDEPSISQIIPGLYIGNVSASLDSSVLEANNITTVVSLVKDHWGLWKKAPYTELITVGHHVWIESTDSGTQDLLRHMAPVCDFIEHMLPDAEEPSKRFVEPPAGERKILRGIDIPSREPGGVLEFQGRYYRKQDLKEVADNDDDAGPLSAEMGKLHMRDHDETDDTRRTLVPEGTHRPSLIHAHTTTNRHTNESINGQDISKMNSASGHPPASASSPRGNVLVHCDQGVSRSVSIVIAFLMRRRHDTRNAVLEFVKSKRSIAKPSRNFMEQLDIWRSCKYQVWEDMEHETRPKPLYAEWSAKRRKVLALKGLSGDEPLRKLSTTD